MIPEPSPMRMGMVTKACSISTNISNKANPTNSIPAIASLINSALTKTYFSATIANKNPTMSKAKKERCAISMERINPKTVEKKKRLSINPQEAGRMNLSRLTNLILSPGERKGNLTIITINKATTAAPADIQESSLTSKNLTSKRAENGPKANAILPNQVTA